MGRAREGYSEDKHGQELVTRPKKGKLILEEDFSKSQEA